MTAEFIGEFILNLPVLYFKRAFYFLIYSTFDCKKEAASQQNMFALSFTALARIYCILVSVRVKYLRISGHVKKIKKKMK